MVWRIFFPFLFASTAIFIDSEAATEIRKLIEERTPAAAVVEDGVNRKPGILRAPIVDEEARSPEEARARIGTSVPDAVLGVRRDDRHR